MLKALSATAAVPSNSDQTVVVGKQSWLSEFSWDFSRRFIELLAYQFRKFSPILVLSIMEAAQSPSNILSNKRIEAGKIIT